MGLTLVLGGIRSGKSAHAVRLAEEDGGRVAVVATGTAEDDEMRARIAAHRAARPAQWTVHETTRELGAIAGKETAQVVLLEVGGRPGRGPRGCRSVRRRAERTGGCVSPGDRGQQRGRPLLGRAHRRRPRLHDTLGLVNQHLAVLAERVDLVVAGLPLKLK